MAIPSPHTPLGSIILYLCRSRRRKIDRISGQASSSEE
jgi:hypothetical protein